MKNNFEQEYAMFLFFSFANFEILLYKKKYL